MGEMINIDTTFDNKEDYEQYMESLNLGDEIEILKLDYTEMEKDHEGIQEIKVLKKIEMKDGSMDSLHELHMMLDSADGMKKEVKRS